MSAKVIDAVIDTESNNTDADQFMREFVCNSKYKSEDFHKNICCAFGKGTLFSITVSKGTSSYLYKFNDLSQIEVLVGNGTRIYRFPPDLISQ